MLGHVHVTYGTFVVRFVVVFVCSSNLNMSLCVCWACCPFYGCFALPLSLLFADVIACPKACFPQSTVTTPQHTPTHTHAEAVCGFAFCAPHLFYVFIAIFACVLFSCSLFVVHTHAPTHTDTETPLVPFLWHPSYFYYTLQNWQFFWQVDLSHCAPAQLILTLTCWEQARSSNQISEIKGVYVATCWLWMSTNLTC